MDIRRKRAYDNATAEDGFRVLVDRLWPRGVSKQRADIDLWAKYTAPTTQLRRDWHAAPDSQWALYAERYREQLHHESAAAFAELVTALCPHPVVTLIYAAHDTEHNHAGVLEAELQRALS